MNVKLISFQKKALMMILGSSILFTGCSDSRIQAKNSVIPDESIVSTVSNLSDENRNIGGNSDDVSVQDNSNPQDTAPITFSLWNDNIGFPERVTYQIQTEGSTSVYETYDKDLIQKLIDAVKQIDIKRVLKERIADDYKVIVFDFENNDIDIDIEFEGMHLLRGGMCYEINGDDDLKAVLREFEEKGTKLTPYEL